MFKNLKQFKLKYKRRGQALVLYALLIPTLLVFAGAGLDLGWYYLTVSRMQNAADNRSVLSTGNKYRTGDKHRFEILRLNGKGGKYGNTDAIKKANPINR